MSDPEIKRNILDFLTKHFPKILNIVEVANARDMTVDIHDYFEHSEVMGFTDFHNYELSDKHEDIISYVMEKFIDFYANFLGGDQRAKIFDLRK